MKIKTRSRNFCSAVVASTLCLLLASSTFAATGQRKRGAKTSIPVKRERVVGAFDERVKEYVKLRERLEDTLPKLSKESEPEEIETHKKRFQELTRSAREGAKRGDVFTPEAAAYIRTVIRREFRGPDRRELRKTVFEAETEGVPLRVNYPYPEEKELSQIPPTLLLALPPLPKQVKYRFVGRNLLLVDRENNLIVDFMTNALP